MRSEHHRAKAIFLLPFFVLLMAVGPIAAQCALRKGRIWIGPPTDPERYYRFATDNGIPGSGRYAYSDYNWPSLRQALQQYGLFGRHFGRKTISEITVVPHPEEPILLKPPRKLGD